ncbi:MAG: TrkH family potassium uptake protein [Oscillospiraceae bacterium]|nr:TrkH family potassium uptake protein [Oscillospiraceae bacterium]
MNYRMILSLLGMVLLLLAGFLLMPCVVALIYGEGDFVALIQTAILCLVLGSLLSLLYPREERRLMHAREGFVMVSLVWILISVVGALPFYLCGAIPSYLDAVFETVSGFTTTGASILTNVEALPHGLLFWRSFTHWIGGMGVLVFMLAIVPLSGESIYLLRAESPGPSVSKMVPKMRTSAAITYGLYIALTVMLFLLYRLGTLFGWGNISWFDSFCLSFGTAGTGGFAIRCDGLASYSTYEQAVTTVFMILFGVNFSIYFFLLCKKYRLAWQNSELKCYIGVILTAIILITLNLVLSGGFFSTVGEAIHHVSFSVGSVITTTGYGTVDFAQWPEFSRTILVLLMVVGACAGSTGGGMKVSRVLILFKSLRAEIRRMLHPHAVEIMTMDKKRVEKSAIQGTGAFLTVYFAILLLSVTLVSLDNLGTETTVTAIFATLNNIGPGTSALIGPFGSFAVFSPLSKVVLIFDMLCGRLEIFPILLLLRPGTWRKY